MFRRPAPLVPAGGSFVLRPHRPIIAQRFQGGAVTCKDIDVKWTVPTSTVPIASAPHSEVIPGATYEEVAQVLAAATDEVFAEMTCAAKSTPDKSVPKAPVAVTSEVERIGVSVAERALRCMTIVRGGEARPPFLAMLEAASRRNPKEFEQAEQLVEKFKNLDKTPLFASPPLVLAIIKSQDEGIIDQSLSNLKCPTNAIKAKHSRAAAYRLAELMLTPSDDYDETMVEAFYLCALIRGNFTKHKFNR